MNNEPKSREGKPKKSFIDDKSAISAAKIINEKDPKPNRGSRVRYIWRICSYSVNNFIIIEILNKISLNLKCLSMFSFL